MLEELLAGMFINQWVVLVSVTLFLLALAEVGCRFGLSSRRRNPDGAAGHSGSVLGAVLGLLGLLLGFSFAMAVGRYDLRRSLADIPETAGVYLFYGENKLPLYIGKSINLRERVMSHFSGDHASSKEMRISQEIKDVRWIQTAGELGALLLESQLIKEKLPIHNRQLRREGQLCSWQIATSPDEKPLVTLIKEDEIQPNQLAHLFGTYRTKKQAVESLRAIANSHRLCPKLLGLESGKGPCFASQLKKCQGACCGKESLLNHYMRLTEALATHRLKAWPYTSAIGIREYCEVSQKSALHVIDQWCHLGTVESEAELETLLENQGVFAFNYDNYKLLEKFIRSKRVEVVQLSNTS